MKPIFVFPLLSAVVACSAVEDRPEAAAIERAPIRCPAWGCGTNSATLGDGLLFDELDSSGRENRTGLRIVSAYLASGAPVKVRVSRHALVAVGADGTVHSDYALVGATIVLKHAVRGIYELRITAVHLQHLMFWSGPEEFVPFYEIKARHDGSPTQKFEYVCKQDLLTTEPWWAQVAHSALVFQGDYYDPDAKTVTAVSDVAPLDSDSRFNVACAGTAPAKMHLTRHTRAGGIDGRGALAYPTTISERQAMLKMFTADYCGTGTAFTVDGQPLTYSDGRTTFARWDEATGIEAVWKESGAVCLNTPRLGAAMTPRVVADCGYTLPSCDRFAVPSDYVTSQLLPLP